MPKSYNWQEHRTFSKPGDAQKMHNDMLCKNKKQKRKENIDNYAGISVLASSSSLMKDNKNFSIILIKWAMAPSTR